MTTTREVAGVTLAPGLYRHIKSGALYTVLGLVRHHETGKPMVIYYSHGHGSLSTRPFHGFVTSRCSDPDGFADRFEPFDDYASITAASNGHIVLWTNETLLRNFALFDAALVGAGKPPRPVPGIDDDDDDPGCGGGGGGGGAAMAAHCRYCGGVACDDCVHGEHSNEAAALDPWCRAGCRFCRL